MKNIQLLTLSFALFLSLGLHAQVGINTDGSAPDSSAMLDVKSTGKGMLIPRMTTAQRTAIANPATGLLVFDNETGSFWFYSGSEWTELVSGHPTTLSDEDNDTKIQVEESADEDKIRFDLSGTEHFVMYGPRLEVLNSGNSVFIGQDAGVSISSGTQNVGVGTGALQTTAVGSSNAAIGFMALNSNTTGSENVALGSNTLENNLNGYRNVAIGPQALNHNTSSHNNIAIGYQALLNHTTGNYNNAVGVNALRSQTNGSFNNAFGTDVLYSNTTGVGNAAFGDVAMNGNISGDYNTAMGTEALANDQSGSYNAAYGYQAGYNATGSGNVFLGSKAGYNETGNDKLYIDNTDTVSPLIYGDFASDSLTVNGTLRINDGTQSTGYVLTSDANGNASWQQLDVLGLLGSSAALDFSCGGKVGSAATGPFPVGQAVSGTIACVVDVSSDDLKVYDLSDPVNPVQVGSLSGWTNPEQVVMAGNYAYVIDWTAGDLKVVDISNPASPVLAGSVSVGTSPDDLVISGNYVYVVNLVSSDLKVIDVSNPASPAVVGTLALATAPHAVAVSGSYAYVVCTGSDDLKVIDVSNPLSPAVVGTLALGTDPWDIEITGDYAVVVDAGSDDLKMIDISNPSSPALLGSVAMGPTPFVLSMKSGYAFVIDPSSVDIKVVDLGDPANPVVVATIPATSSPGGVVVQGNLAYVIDDGDAELQVYELSCDAGLEVTVNAWSGEQAGMVLYDDIANTLLIFDGFDWVALEDPVLDYWSLTGNAGTDTATHFIGTTDDMPVDIKVNNQRVMRYQDAADSPNLIGGYSGNTVDIGVKGATIAGGGMLNEKNVVKADFGVVGGGSANIVQGVHATIGGGQGNEAEQQFSTVAGGKDNLAWGLGSTISGGYDSEATSSYGTIGGGYQNYVTGGSFATVPGGRNNRARGKYSFAAGRKAWIDPVHGGTFLYADSSDLYFYSAAANEFAVRATGGVRFVTNIDGAGNPTETITMDSSGIVTASSFIAESGNGPAVTLYQNTSDGNDTYTWKMIGAPTQFSIQDVTNAGKLPFRIAPGSANNRIIINGDNVGIGMGIFPSPFPTPTETLDVNGRIRMRAGAATGYVPVSDADGVMIWTDPLTLGTNSWNLNGNAGTDTSTNFIGTTDNKPFIIKVNNTTAMQIVSDSTTVNLIGGYEGNTISGTSFGSTISGGGDVVGINTITGLSFYSTISGGAGNSITFYGSTIGGGMANQVTSAEVTVSGGADNSASGLRSTIGGGRSNTASGTNSTVAGGGGFGSGVSQGNAASGNSSTVGGGSRNTASGGYSTVPGGDWNSAGGDYSFAAGRKAKIDAAHDGTFLFADQNDKDFNSTSANEFAVRATGGVRFVTAINGSGNPTQTVSMNNAGTVTASSYNAESGDSPLLSLYQNASGGFGTYTWNVGGNEANFFIRDVTNSSKLPFRLFPGAASNRITITGNNVGIGLATETDTIPTATESLDVGGNIRMREGAATGYVPVSDADGVMTWTDPSTLGIGDDLGNHIATQNIVLNGNYLSGDGGNEGIFVATDGKVGINTNSVASELDVNGDMTLTEAGTTLYERRIGFSYIPGAGLPNYQTRYSYIAMEMDGDANLSSPAVPFDQRMDFNISNNSTTGTVNVLSLFGNGRIGMGTTAPSNKLTVSGSADFTGNVGIGKSNPSSPLHVEKTLDNGTLMTLTNNGTGNANILKVTSGSTGSTDIVDIQNGAFIVEGNGNIGFGTTSPTQAKVVINGSASNNLGSYGYLNRSGNTGTASGSNPYSLYVSERIAASEFNAHSDERIKNIKGASDGGEDLATLMQLEVTDYTYRDSIGKGSTPQKKVIAQQVAEVYKQAVSKNLTEVIPDIYQRAEVKDGWIMLSTDLTKGEKVKIITESTSDVHEITEVEANRFKVDQLITDNPQLFTVFVYGREVNDFHTVDYEAISMLNVSATQELARQNEAQQKEIDILKAQVQEMEILRAENAKMAADIEAIKAALLSTDKLTVNGQ